MRSRAEVLGGHELGGDIFKPLLSSRTGVLQDHRARELKGSVACLQDQAMEVTLGPLLLSSY